MERETTTIELVVEVEGQIYRVQKQYTKRNKEMDKNKVLKKLLIGKCFSEVGRFLSLSI